MRAQSIPEAFAASAATEPERVALSGAGVLTYAELATRAERIAGHLLARGIGAGQRIALYANRSVDSIATIIGVLKTGAAYVPLDTAYPAGLLRYLYEDSAPAALLLDESVADRPQFWQGEALSLRELSATPSAAPVAWPVPAATDPAYLMYTSGSTGRPKGVLVPHQAVLRLVLGNDFAHFGADEV